MEQLKGLPLGRQLILGAGILLLIDTFLAWQQVSVGPFTASRDAWHGFWGVILSLLLILLLAWVVVRVLGIEIPLNLPDGLTTLAASAVVLLFAIIKALSDSYVHWPAYVGIILAAVMAYGAWLVFQESGESLPNIGQMGSGPSTGGGSGTDSGTPTG